MKSATLFFILVSAISFSYANTTQEKFIDYTSCGDAAIESRDKSLNDIKTSYATRINEIRDTYKKTEMSLIEEKNVNKKELLKKAGEREILDTKKESKILESKSEDVWKIFEQDINLCREETGTKTSDRLSDSIKKKFSSFFFLFTKE